MNILDQEISRKGLEKCSVNETFYISPFNTKVGKREFDIDVNNVCEMIRIPDFR